jgi:hypothetical protein
MMANWEDTLMSIAPTVATALVGPLGGVAVGALGKVFGLDNATTTQIAGIIQNGQMTPDQLSEIKKLEMQYQNDEAERGFKYENLAFQDRDSARKANVAGGIQMELFWMSIFILAITIGTEIFVLFYGYPKELDDIIVGRILGLMDGVTMLVLAYWYGTTNQNRSKDSIIANSTLNSQLPSSK